MNIWTKRAAIRPEELNLGGGTFGVSLLTTDFSVFEVLANNSDTHLGKEDSAKGSMDHFMKLYKKKTGKDICNDNRERGGDEQGDVLVPVSHDGRVVQWTIQKGFESLDLMKIKVKLLVSNLFSFFFSFLEILFDLKKDLKKLFKFFKRKNFKKEVEHKSVFVKV